MNLNNNSLPTITPENEQRKIDTLVVLGSGNGVPFDEADFEHTSDDNLVGQIVKDVARLGLSRQSILNAYQAFTHYSDNPGISTIVFSGYGSNPNGEYPESEAYLMSIVFTAHLDHYNELHPAATLPSVYIELEEESTTTQENVEYTHLLLREIGGTTKAFDDKPLGDAAYIGATSHRARDLLLALCGEDVTFVEPLMSDSKKIQESVLRTLNNVAFGYGEGATGDPGEGLTALSGIKKWTKGQLRRIHACGGSYS